jgi:CBS domain-containing protein
MKQLEKLPEGEAEMDNPFHDVGNIFPGEIELQTVAPDTRVGDALRLMMEKRFSQLPVIENGEVLGMFSLWSLAHHLSLSPGLKVQTLLQELEVGDVMEQVPKITVKDSIHSILDQLERHEALLVDSPHGLQAIATSTDVLRYFYRVARPFILLQEIEMGLREIIHMCAPGAHLTECIDRALIRSYQARGGTAPQKLEEMSFEDYRSIITSGQNWPLFENVLGHNRDLVSAKLERLRSIRNDVFHFRSDISILDYQTLANAREWLLGKLKRGLTVGKEEGHV